MSHDINDLLDNDDLDAAFGDHTAISSSSDASDFSMDEDIRGDDQIGAGPATDLQRAEYTEPPTRDASPDEQMTDYGAHPWNPGSSSGYRPMSMAMTDRAMGETPKAASAKRRDANAGIDPMTIYDRDAHSWNYGGDTVGHGIFDMEESSGNLPGYGIFGNQYALPGYLAREPIMDVEQSEMWDIEAGDWRVVQPSAGGVPLSRRVNAFKAYSPFQNGDKKAASWAQLRPMDSGPQSHIEAYGRGAAAIVMQASKHIPDVKSRSAFIESALASLGPRAAVIANKAVQKLVQFGYPAEKALEDTVAHLIMNQTAKEIRWGSHLPHLDSLVKRTGAWGQKIAHHAAETVGPVLHTPEQKKLDLGRLYNSPAGQAMGQLGEDTPAVVSTPSSNKILTPRNLLIGGAVAVGGYFLWQKFGKKRKGTTP